MTMVIQMNLNVIGGSGELLVEIVDVVAGEEYDIVVGTGGSGGWQDTGGTTGGSSSAFSFIARRRRWSWILECWYKLRRRRNRRNARIRWFKWLGLY